ncbi:hypothetical protein LINPERPRIM_LOCUS36875, partial [Linum perenne]
MLQIQIKTNATVINWRIPGKRKETHQEAEEERLKDKLGESCTSVCPSAHPAETLLAR